MAESKGQHRSVVRHKHTDRHVDAVMLSARTVRACGDKIGYPSKGHAMAAASRFVNLGRQKPGWHINTYKCKGCGKWHFGHSRSPMKSGDE